MRIHDFRARCSAMVESCNETLGWGLDKRANERYVDALIQLVDEQVAHDELRTRLVNYHADHEQVEALRDALHPQHVAAWQQWTQQILGVLRANGLAWSADAAVDLEDLAQFVRAELVRALPSYRYRSRLSSWVYQLAVQSVVRQVRYAHAAKRATRPDPLDALAEHSGAPDPADGPELLARAGLLAEQVGAILAAQPDQRLGYIFYLWAVKEKSTAEIGALVQLHASRVRALLAQARQLLRAHPAIQAWHDDESPSPPSA